MSSWTSALASAVTENELTPEQHTTFANWHDTEIRKAWSRRNDLPPHLIQERIRVENDEQVLAQLLSHLQEVDDTTLEVAIRRGRATALAVAFTPGCSDEQTVRILKHLRHQKRGWLEHQLSQESLAIFAGRTKTLQLLTSSMNLSILWRISKLLDTEELQQAALQRLTGLRPESTSTIQTYAVAAKIPWTILNQVTFDKLTREKGENVRRAVANATGKKSIDEGEEILRAQLMRRRHEMLTHIQQNEPGLGKLLQELYLEVPYGYKLATELARTALDQDGLPLEEALKVLTIADPAHLEEWTLRAIRSETHTAGELAQIAATVAGALGGTSHITATQVSRQKRILTEIGDHNWNALQRALELRQGRRNDVLAAAALHSAETSEQLRWLQQNHHANERAVLEHPACDTTLLLAQRPIAIMSLTRRAREAAGHILATTPPEKLETLDRLLPEWQGTLGELLEAAQQL